MKKLISFFILLLCPLSFAAPIQFPDDELPSEVVLPSGISSAVILHQKVQFHNKWQLSMGVGSLLDDPYFEGTHLQAAFRYYYSPYWAVGIKSSLFLKKTSSYAVQFQDQNGLNFDQAPSLQQSHFLEAQWLPYYGKISFSQETVLPHTFFVNMGVGVLRYLNSSTTFPGLTGGFGQNFFLDPSFSLDYQMGLMFHNGPNVLSQNLSQTVTDSYTSKYQTHFIFNLGVSKLF